MSENLNSYADGVLEKKIKNSGSGVEAQIEGLDSRVTALEEGGSGGDASILICTLNGETYYIDKTWKEIKDSLSEGVPVFVNLGRGNDANTYSMSPVIGVDKDSEAYYVWILLRNGNELKLFDMYALSENDYPALD